MKNIGFAVNAAQKAFDGSWLNLSKRKSKIFKRIANELKMRSSWKIETIDTGKLFKETKTQANYIAEYYDYYAGLADKVEGTVFQLIKLTCK